MFTGGFFESPHSLTNDLIVDCKYGTGTPACQEGRDGEWRLQARTISTRVFGYNG